MLVGRSDCSIIKNPHFGSPLHFPFSIFYFPFSIFQNIFFWTSSLPPKKLQMQKITNANTNTKIIFWRQTKTDKMTCIFFIGRWLQIWHLVDSLLTPCWHLSDTLLTPCWSFFKCAIVRLWQLDNPLHWLSSIAKFLCNNFLPLQNVLMQSGFLHLSWPNTFFGLP